MENYLSLFSLSILVIKMIGWIMWMLGGQVC